MDDGLVERLQAVERVGPMRRVLAQVIEQPRMRGLERGGLLVAELPGEVFADQRMGVDGIRRHGQEIDFAQPFQGDVPLRVFQLHQRIGQAGECAGSARRACRQSRDIGRSKRPVSRSTASSRCRSGPADCSQRS